MRTHLLDHIILLLAVLCAVLMLVLGTVLVFGPRGSSRVSAAPPSVYFLKDDGGFPALFRKGSSLPLRTYPTIYTHLLPPADAEALQNGIVIRDEKQLQALLEDLDG